MKNIFTVIFIQFAISVSSFASDFRQITFDDDCIQTYKRKNDWADIRQPKRLKLHPKVNENILKDNNLIHEEKWCNVNKIPGSSCRISRKHNLINPHRVSLLKSESKACYAIHPNKESVLGRGGNGWVKLGQCMKEGDYLWPEGSEVGTWIAIKFQREAFDEQEIQALERAGRLIDRPIEFLNRKREKRYAVPMRLVSGITLWEWLEKQDPHKEWTLDKWLELDKKIDRCLQKQVHKNSMTFQDNNLDNILVDEKSGAFTVVDFGNAFIFDDVINNIEFEAMCNDDFIRLHSSVFDYMQGKEYPETVQNLYWISLFLRVFEDLRRYDALDFQLSSARELLDMYYVTWPPLFTDVFESEELENLTDEDIKKYCLKFIG